jgi:CCR4-NOT transcription complex subunit 7/8
MSSFEKNKKNKSKKEGNNLNNIKEVYIDNFEEEIKKVSLLIDKYNYISMDTEFPGIVYNNNYKPNIGESSSYTNIKTNVDRLKVIQVGITLSDECGDSPSDISTWQFNFDFNLKKDNYSAESIHLLINSGINFDILSEKGIPMEKFGEFFLTSGLVINENINWITFHGSYDFAYLLKIVTAQLLPEKVESFVCDLDLFFKNYFDIRYLTQNQENFRGSLNKLAYDLNVDRLGSQHQAGSDSLVTSKCFFKLRDLGYINEEDIMKGRNQIYCLNAQEDTYQEVNSNYYNNYGG